VPLGLANGVVAVLDVDGIAAPLVAGEPYAGAVEATPP
jgi:hypothetical protein